ncbi:MAG: alpha/beta fold hydrolase [Proteobacteria bacterium]|nr:alpha/beta fold hydrolase [Pseudomonadota bacterium]
MSRDAPIMTGPEFWAWVDGQNGRQRIKVNGGVLRVLDLGRGRPLVLLHGYADTAYTWHRVVPGLIAAGYRLVAPDLPGFGASAFEIGFDYSPETMVRALMAMADHLGLDRFFVAGNSLGGGLTLLAALEFPERVTAAAVLDPACYPMKLVWSLALIKSRLFGPLATALMSRAMIRFTARRLVFDPGAVSDDFIDELAGPRARRDYRKNLRQVLRAFDTDRVHARTAEYDRMATPTMIVWGRQDRLIPASLGRRLARDLPRSKLVELDHCGHAPQLERPGDVVRELTAWFDPLP